MDKKRSYDYLFKILLIGDSGVGKTCLLCRYVDDSFTANFISTIGIDFKSKYINVESPDSNDETTLKLQIWDTAGQERFQTITQSYYRGAFGIIIVYDVSDAKSFENVGNWIKATKDHASRDVDVIIVGNKCDVEAGKRQVTREEGEAKARDFGVDFIETSAKENINVTDAFKILIDHITQRLVKTGKLESQRGSRHANIQVDSPSPRAYGCC